MDAAEWAKEEFGNAQFGDRRRVDRLVALAAATVERPSGFVAPVVPVGAARTGAYRFLRNRELAVDPVSAAAWLACMGRVEGLPFVNVAEDGSSLALTDNDGVLGTGVVGSHTNGARGFIVMNAIAMAPDGNPSRRRRTDVAESRREAGGGGPPQTRAGREGDAALGGARPDRRDRLQRVDRPTRMVPDGPWWRR